MVSRVAGTCGAILLAAVPAAAGSLDEARSQLPPEAREWVDRSCSRSLGPAMWKMCVESQLEAFAAGMPDPSVLTEEQQRWVSDSCSETLSPAMWKMCVESQ